jgi:pyruvate/2-oxoglutarate dehydrogenase complex dihydrolipoamide dehydrogenase (E3) component
MNAMKQYDFLVIGSRKGGKFLATIQVAMLSGMKAGVLRNAIFSHPTMAEAISERLCR